ncbi:MAG: DUF4230 domain-containing protein [Chitinophagaceae bacterium]|nr:DUF4230 domain-containing protein [Chitinophagaceae bacterium]MCW5929129.1 DUF4230 domain-containing protein [Chitinophagaceae bacterium]
MLKRYMSLALILGIIIILLFVFRKQWMSSIGDLFKPAPVLIDETPILVKEINELAQLCTISVYSEVVADTVAIEKKSAGELLLPDFSGFSGLPVKGRRLVLVGRGRVIAGTDLKKLQSSDIIVQGDSVSLTIPRAEILDAIMNPSDFDIFSEIGKWEPDAVTAVKVKARTRMINEALEQQVLEKADARSRMLIENFLLSVGFRKVSVRIV